MLTLIPQGGLCNRMRAIDAAIELCLEADTPLHIQWHKDPGLNCAFDELFIQPEVVLKVETIDYNGSLAQLVKSTRKFYYRYKYDNFMPEPELLKFIENGHDLVSIIKTQNSCFATCQRFYDLPPYYSKFRPLDKYLEAAAYLIPDGQQIIGVHIRRSDHKSAIANSPLKAFERAMRDELDDNPDCRFFLATDSLQAELYLREIFPDIIISHTKEDYQRNNQQTIKDALVDVIGLSRTTKILGSYESSFSNEAAYFGGCNLHIVK